MWSKTKNQIQGKASHTGFTIVELLIVIVVIGILAAITIVAYNGIQTRAKNASIEQSVSTYKKALIAYATQHGSYPTVGGACLGAVSDYPSNCFIASASTTFETNMKTLLSSLPSPNKDCFTGWGGCRLNFTFYSSGTWTVDGQPHQYYLIYYIGGGSNCSLPHTLEGNYGSFATTTTRGYMERRGTESMCVLALPDPSL